MASYRRHITADGRHVGDCAAAIALKMLLASLLREKDEENVQRIVCSRLRTSTQPSFGDTSKRAGKRAVPISKGKVMISKVMRFQKLLRSMMSCSRIYGPAILFSGHPLFK